MGAAAGASVKSTALAHRHRTGLAGARRPARQGPRLPAAPFAPAAPAALENLAKTVAKSRQAQRLRARGVLRSLTRHERVSTCGYALGEARLRQAADGSAGMAGLETCASVWSCPCCSSKIAMHRTDEMESGIRHWSTAGGSFVMLTLTMQHRKGQSLRSLWDGLSGAWSALMHDGSYRRTIRRLGVSGFHRTTEVTVGANGWHVHLHVVYFVTGKPRQVDSVEAGSGIVGLWMRHVAAQGFSAVPDAQDWKILRGSGDALASVAGYVHKGEYVDRVQSVKPVRSLAMEVTRGDLKASKGGRTPFGVLADIVASVEDSGEIAEDDWALWSEWEEVSRGRRQQVWSRGMRERVGLAESELSDDEAAAVELAGVDLVAIPAGAWRTFSRDGRAHAELLAAVEASSGGFLAARMAAASVLRKYGCDHSLLDPPDIG